MRKTATPKQPRSYSALATALLLGVLLAPVIGVSASRPALATTSAEEMLYDHDGDGIGDFREFAGNDRYETAFRLADNYIRHSEWWHGSRTVLLASGETLVDAMSVVGLAGILGAPVILTEGDELHYRAKELIESKNVLASDRHRLGLGKRVQMAQEVIILGGRSAIGLDVEQHLRHMLADTCYRYCEHGQDEDTLGADWTPEQAERASRVVRVHGPDRYSTAAAIARRIRRDARDPSRLSHLAQVPGSWCGGYGDAAILVDGNNSALPYAMLAGPMATRSGLPMLMSDGARLPPATIDAIRDLDIAHVAIIGGNHVVPSTIEAQLRSSGISTVDRVGGTSPAAVSVELAKLIRGDCADHLWTPHGGVSRDIVALVNAAALPDGVAAAPVLAGSLADGDLVPLLLVGGTLSQPVDQYLREMRQSAGYGAGGGIQVVAIGGIASVNRCVVEDALGASAKSSAVMPVLNERFAAASRGSRLRIADLSVAYTDQAAMTASLKWSYRVHVPGKDTDKSADALRAWQFRECYAPTMPMRAQIRYWTAPHFMYMMSDYIRYGHRPDLSWSTPSSRIPIDAPSFDSETIHQIETRATVDLARALTGLPDSHQAIIFTARGLYQVISSDSCGTLYGDGVHPDRPFPCRRFHYTHCAYDACRDSPTTLPMSFPLHPMSLPEKPGAPPLVSGRLADSLILHHTLGRHNEIHFSLMFLLEMLQGTYSWSCGTTGWPHEMDESQKRCLDRLWDLPTFIGGYAPDIPQHLQVQWTGIDKSDDASAFADWDGAESKVIAIFEDMQKSIVFSSTLTGLSYPRNHDFDLAGFYVRSILTYSIGVSKPNTKYLVRIRLVKDPEGSEPVGDWTKAEWTVPANPHKELSNKIEKDVVEALGKKHGWLRDTWQHMKAYNAKVVSHWPDGPADERGYKTRYEDAAGTAGFRCRQDTQCVGEEVWVSPSCASRRRCFKGIVVHELAHIYTLTSTSEDRRPAALGAAAMYFFHLANGHVDCPAHELWADALARSVVGSQYWSSYWHECPKTPSRPTREALKIVADTIDGTWPSWFRKRYGTSDPDKFDLRKIWSDLDDYREQKYEHTGETYEYGYRFLDPILAHFAEVFGEPCLEKSVLDATGHPWVGDECTSS